MKLTKWWWGGWREQVAIVVVEDEVVALQIGVLTSPRVEVFLQFIHEETFQLSTYSRHCVQVSVTNTSSLENVKMCYYSGISHG